MEVVIGKFMKLIDGGQDERFKQMKAELFCASPASTAICTTMNQHAMVRRGSGGSSTPRPINHRHHDYYNNHYQFDFNDKPKFKTRSIPCTSQQHIDPKPYLIKTRKSTSSEKRVDDKNSVLLSTRKSSAELNDKNIGRVSSSRFLLNNPIFVADLKDNGVCNSGALVVSEPIWPDYDHHGRDSTEIKKSWSSRRSLGDDSPALGKSRSSSIRLGAVPESPGSKSSRSRSGDQVVELRVSIHCKGCEGKVRKHISRMEVQINFELPYGEACVRSYFPGNLTTSVHTF